MAEPVTYTVSLTPSAIEEIHRLMENGGQNRDSALRVGVKGGGCSGLSYVLEFDQPSQFDDHFDISGIPVIVDKRHALYVAGMEVDYQHGLNDRGFIFRNPNAKTTCGCGTSFST